MSELKQIDSLILSEWVIGYVNKMGYDISQLKLQKLLYYLDAWHHVYFDMPLIEDDFEAWTHGPVSRKVWDYYKAYSVLYRSLTVDQKKDNNIKNFLNGEQVELCQDVLDEYGDKTAYYLECLTHSEDPWRYARKGYQASDSCNVIMPKTDIKNYYWRKLYVEET